MSQTLHVNGELPLIMEPDELESLLHDRAGQDSQGNQGHQGPQPLVVDLSDAEKYQARHIPGAVHLDVSRLMRKAPPAMGLLPTGEQLDALFQDLGLTPDTHVVAYDSEGSGRASRLLWTLDVAGHQAYSLLNGGAMAWFQEGHPAATGPGPEQAENPPGRGHYPIADIANAPAQADKHWLLENLGRDDLAVLDARSPAEFSGDDRRADRGGHIPGAANLNWTDALDPDNHGRLRSAQELLDMLRARGITPDREVVTHCQTHHRSALLWVVLKSLGFQRVRGYAGSWSEWGNALDTPVETGGPRVGS